MFGQMNGIDAIDNGLGMMMQPEESALCSAVHRPKMKAALFCFLTA
jgi:hypothetical protein